MDFRINEDSAKFKIGIDLGGTNIKVGILDSKNNILKKRSVKTLVERDWKEVIGDMAKLTTDLIDELGLNIELFEYVGIGSPGAIDSQNGSIIFSSNFHGWEGVNIKNELERLIKLPVKISNDANCATLGEVEAGIAKGYKNAILFTIGTGIGGGIVLDGKLFESSAGATELGHTILKKDGLACGCGRKGCFEMYTNAGALIRETRNAASNNHDSLLWKHIDGDLDKIDGKFPFDMAELGDEDAKNVIKEYLSNLGEGITDFVNIFRPDIIILSGGVSAQGEKLTVPITEHIIENAYGKGELKIPLVKIATLGNDAGIVGAANL